MVMIAAVLWSTMALLIRHIEAADTWTLLFWRSFGLVPGLLLVIWWRSAGQFWDRMQTTGVSGIIGGFGLVLAFAGAIFAIQSTTVANAVFLFSASPFLAAVLGWVLLKEPVRKATWVAIAVAGLGMYIMVREGLAAGALQGNIAALLSALGFAIFTLALRWGKLADMLPSVVIGAILSMLTAAAVQWVRGVGLAVSAHDLVIALVMGAVVLGIGMTLYTAGSKVIPAAELTLLSMIEVLLAPFWVWLFLGETASSGTLLGGFILMAAVAFNAVSGARNRRKSALIA